MHRVQVAGGPGLERIAEVLGCYYRWAKRVGGGRVGTGLARPASPVEWPVR